MYSQGRKFDFPSSCSKSALEKPADVFVEKQHLFRASFWEIEGMPQKTEGGFFLLANGRQRACPQIEDTQKTMVVGKATTIVFF